MVNSVERDELGSTSLASVSLARVKRLVAAYVVVALGTLVALAVLAVAAPHLATSEAWGHAVIVAVFAIVLPVRTRAALKGSPSGLRALTIIGCVLLVVNLVEAALPGVFPAWMRVEMLVIAAMMLTLAILSIRVRRNRQPVADDQANDPR
ncbi:peptidoglycan/LPS O-acetylase OafA/YrhL [Streptosporangium album]|uniref:Peptidoglycan/LPS O-acetylase OafA/YrhL n=1 Tax=Streptosporangium album TaxID=47479 RepID=A0A7W7WD83_9ACTN|nr:hypothetical protein [Streptosporangium album]MBB4942841.1 peptidoglycan/LPS O-acetylase OafA/YrhL [Streptosporangium album]